MVAKEGALHVIVLSGGSGTRLWPLSSPERPKQFLQVLRDDKGAPESMVQRTTRLVCAHAHPTSLTIATGEDQVRLLEEQMRCPHALSLEPCRRSTAAAIMLACAKVAELDGAHTDDTVVVLPIDTYAEDAYYERIATLHEIVQRGDTDLVLMGASPTRPSERYGYIVCDTAGEREGDALPVLRFQEKPSAEVAARLVASGALWNCGVFGFRLGWIQGVTRTYAADLSFEGLRTHYQLLPKESFDYAVVERGRSMAVVPYAGVWDDLGTWDTLATQVMGYGSGPVWTDTPSSAGLAVVNETELPLVVSGLTDAVVVATGSGILVCTPEASERMRSLTEQAARYAPARDACARKYVLAAGEELDLWPAPRDTVWVVADGAGEVRLGTDTRAVGTGDTISISAGDVARVTTVTGLSIWEVPVGPDASVETGTAKTLEGDRS